MLGFYLILAYTVGGDGLQRLAYHFYMNDREA
jgi:hypothetical protein